MIGHRAGHPPGPPDRERQVRFTHGLWILLCLVSATFSQAGRGADAVPSPVAVLGQLPSVEMIEISPTSKYIAFVCTNGDKRTISVYGVAEKAIVYGVRVSEQKLRGIEWVDDEHLIVEVSMTAAPIGLSGGKREWYLGQSINIKTHKVVPFNFEVKDKETMNVLVSPVTVRRVQGSLVAFAEGLYLAGDEYIDGLFRIDPETGRTKLIAESNGGSPTWLIDADGVVRAVLEYDGARKKWTLKVRKDNRLSTVATGEAGIDRPQLLGVTEDAGVGVITYIEDGIPVYKRLSLTDGKLLDDFKPADGMENLITERLSPRIIGGHNATSESTTFFDPALQNEWTSMHRAIPGAVFDWVSNSDDYRRWIMRVMSPTDGYGYHLFDLDARRGVKLMDIYDGLTTIAEPREFAYKAQDGLTIPAILTLPPDREPKNLPLVVLPHGGPQERDTVDFDWWVEALALQGYAVLQPNFRGSTVSLAHVRAGHGEWGKKMQTDLSDGVRDLVRQGRVDPKRVCIVGASYGGYAAMAGPTLDPGVYRCAVAVAGISDLGRFLDWVTAEHGGYSNSAERYWSRFTGAKGADDPHLRDISPVHHVANATVPVLLIHGKDDTVVPFDQSEVMRDALKKAGKPVEFVTLKGEDHWLSTSSTRRQMLEATVNFLKINNPPD